MFDPRLKSDIKRSQSFSLRFRESFHQYLLSTTLHGLKYVGDRTITRLERFFFAFMFLVVLILSGFFITNVWNRWNTSPIIVVLDAQGFSIRDVPFPAVTICNMNQAQKSAVSKIPHSSEEFSALQSICRYQKKEKHQDIGDGKWETFRKVLLDVAQPCKHMLVACRYGGEEVDCNYIFDTILTDSGLCCIFNRVHRKFMFTFKYNRSENFNDNDYLEKMANNWTPETGFHSHDLKNHKDGYPRPAKGSGNHLGLSIILNTTIAEYYCSSTNAFGFKVLLHSPDELPEVDHYGIAIANGYESHIVATPVESTASRDIRNIPVDIRRCLFENENSLKLYQTYSRSNCRMECESNLYLEHCDCVLYYMPRPHYDSRICGRSDLQCNEKLKMEIASRKNDSFKCNCLYGCHGIRYDMRLSTTPIFNQTPLLKIKDVFAENIAILHVYYETTVHRAHKKEQLIGLTEFLSNCGGLLGLFMGFSAFSIIEIFYFLMIRPFCNRIQDDDKQRLTFDRMRKVSRFNSNNNDSIKLNSIVVHHFN